jgi:hypothetical protein
MATGSTLEEILNGASGEMPQQEAIRILTERGFQVGASGFLHFIDIKPLPPSETVTLPLEILTAIRGKYDAGFQAFIERSMLASCREDGIDVTPHGLYADPDPPVNSVTGKEYSKTVVLTAQDIFSTTAIVFTHGMRFTGDDLPEFGHALYWDGSNLYDPDRTCQRNISRRQGHLI